MLLKGNYSAGGPCLGGQVTKGSSRPVSGVWGCPHLQPLIQLSKAAQEKRDPNSYFYIQRSSLLNREMAIHKCVKGVQGPARPLGGMRGPPSFPHIATTGGAKKGNLNSYPKEKVFLKSHPFFKH